MGKTLQQLMAALSPERRKRVADRVVKMIAEERARRDRRLARLVTQLRVKRSDVQRTDVLLSTLRDHVRKMGGELVITVQLPGREPVRIAGIADIARWARSSRSSRPAASGRDRIPQRAHVSAGTRKSQRKRGAVHPK